MRFVLIIVFAAALLASATLAPRQAAAQAGEAEALNQRVIELHRAGKYNEAIPLAERYGETMKARHGIDHPEYATALNNLAELLRVTNRPGEAEPLMRRALEIDEKSLGPEHPKVAIRLNKLVF